MNNARFVFRCSILQSVLCSFKLIQHILQALVTDLPDRFYSCLLLRLFIDTAVGSTLVRLVATDGDAGTELLYIMSASWMFHSPPENVFTIINYT